MKRCNSTKKVSLKPTIQLEKCTRRFLSEIQNLIYQSLQKGN
ncbi:hypothetical protein [Helicobacter rodentium]|nr:hypothetical protein [Helicobacter rodentium]